MRPREALKFPLSDCDVRTGRARRGNTRLGAHMTQQLRSLENGARKRGGAMKRWRELGTAKRKIRTAWPKG